MVESRDVPKAIRFTSHHEQTRRAQCIKLKLLGRAADFRNGVGSWSRCLPRGGQIADEQIHRSSQLRACRGATMGIAMMSASKFHGGSGLFTNKKTRELLADFHACSSSGLGAG